MVNFFNALHVFKDFYALFTLYDKYLQENKKIFDIPVDQVYYPSLLIAFKHEVYLVN